VFALGQLFMPGFWHHNHPYPFNSIKGRRSYLCPAVCAIVTSALSFPRHPHPVTLSMTVPHACSMSLRHAFRPAHSLYLWQACSLAAFQACSIFIRVDGPTCSMAVSQVCSMPLRHAFRPVQDLDSWRACALAAFHACSISLG
jgi:hypothetical protein